MPEDNDGGYDFKLVGYVYEPFPRVMYLECRGSSPDDLSCHLIPAEPVVLAAPTAQAEPPASEASD